MGMRLGFSSKISSESLPSALPAWLCLISKTAGSDDVQRNPSFACYISLLLSSGISRSVKDMTSVVEGRTSQRTTPMLYTSTFSVQRSFSSISGAACTAQQAVSSPLC